MVKTFHIISTALVDIVSRTSIKYSSLDKAIRTAGQTRKKYGTYHKLTICIKIKDHTVTILHVTKLTDVNTIQQKKNTECSTRGF